MIRLYWPICVGVPLRLAVVVLNVIPGGTPPWRRPETPARSRVNVYEPLPAGVVNVVVG